ncbi:MAG: hypothetical protein WBK08_04180, partial [Nitrospira sp.]
RLCSEGNESYPGRSPRCFGGSKLGVWQRTLNAGEKSAEGIVGGSHRRRPERWKTNDHDEERRDRI